MESFYLKNVCNMIDRNSCQNRHVIRNHFDKNFCLSSLENEGVLPVAKEIAYEKFWLY